MRLKNKIAVVTGGGSGFGAGIAHLFAENGAMVAVLDINGGAAAAVAKEIGKNALAVTADVTKRGDIDAAIKATTAHFGKLDVVVNNAGWSHRNQPMLDVSEEDYDKVYAINVKSIFHMTKATVPVLAAQGGGVIINIGSVAGIRPRPGLTWYNGSKGAVNLMSRSMAVELAPLKIRVNCVAPVMGATALLEQFMGGPDTPESRAKFIATIPLGRLAEPRDIAAACVYLASDEANLVTGVVLEVDGGRTI